MSRAAWVCPRSWDRSGSPADARTAGSQEAAAEVGASDWAALRCGEHPPPGVPVPREVLGKSFDQELRHGRRPLRRFRFRWTKPDLAAGLGEILYNLELAAEHVEAVHAGAETRVRVVRTRVRYLGSVASASCSTSSGGMKRISSWAIYEPKRFLNSLINSKKGIRPLIVPAVMTDCQGCRKQEIWMANYSMDCKWCMFPAVSSPALVRTTTRMLPPKDHPLSTPPEWAR